MQAGWCASHMPPSPLSTRSRLRLQIAVVHCVGRLLKAAATVRIADSCPVALGKCPRYSAGERRRHRLESPRRLASLVALGRDVEHRRHRADGRGFARALRAQGVTFATHDVSARCHASGIVKEQSGAANSSAFELGARDSTGKRQPCEVPASSAPLMAGRAISARVPQSLRESVEPLTLPLKATRCPAFLTPWSLRAPPSRRRPAVASPRAPKATAATAGRMGTRFGRHGWNAG
jgi:hypothetical protein